jgi:tetratricopeptide (TPR) repeat protein
MANGQLDAALAGMNRAVQLDPLAFATLLISSIWHSFAGRYEEALALSDRAMEFGPKVFVPLLAERSFILMNLGRQEEAVALARRVARDPGLQPRWWSDPSAIYVLRQAGLEREAVDYAERLQATLPADFSLRSFIAIARGRHDDALEHLTLRMAPSSTLGTVLYTPLWDEVRDDPRFIQIIADHGLSKVYESARASRARLSAEPPSKP